MIEKLIEDNKNLIYSLCLKYANYCDKEDLYQQGVIGLINAYKNYDKSKNVKFSTYAFPYIVGEINNYVRENKNIKVSKDIIRLGRKIKEYIDKFNEVKGYDPSLDYLEKILEVPKDKIILALDSVKSVKRLDEKINDEGKEITLMDNIICDEKISKEEMIDLKESFNLLSKEEQKLIFDRYYNNITQNELAKNMNVNQVYISRLEKKALVKMKNYMI